MPCPICSNREATDVATGGQHWDHTVTCARCGTFDYQVGFGPKVGSPEEMVRLSGWVREQNSAGIPHPRINRDTVARVTRVPRLRFRERALRVLSVLYARSPGGRYAAFTFAETGNDPELQGRSYSL